MNNELLKVLQVFQNFNLESRSILIGYRGSITHGTYVPKNNPNCIDDKDIMGICVPPKEYYFGLQNFEQYENFVGEWDVVIYSIKKMFNLLIKNNPNVLSLLWLNKNHYIKVTELGQKIIDNRNLFSSKESYKSFCGYAYGQLHRMTHGVCLGYMGEKRKQLVQKYGYDTKNASHLIRLLKMGIEFLSTGELTVDRPEKHQLIEIKKGLWTLEQVKNLSDELFKNIELAFINSELPNHPNQTKVTQLLLDITEEILKK